LSSTAGNVTTHIHQYWKIFLLGPAIVQTASRQLLNTEVQQQFQSTPGGTFSFLLSLSLFFVLKTSIGTSTSCGQGNLEVRYEKE